jgi:cytochrome c heme-lyase
MHEANKPKEPTPPPSCPMHNKDNKEAPKLFNLDNNIPFLPNEPVSDQNADLSLDREISSIPKANSETNWEYPSPQQFYNALKRKGWETPEDKIDVMVDIHNFLNEGAWEEVMKWERLHKW